MSPQTKDPAEVADATLSDWVSRHPGIELRAGMVAAATGVHQSLVNYWLRDRERGAHPEHPMTKQLHKVAYGVYVYFPGPVPMDWRDRVNAYAQSKKPTRKQLSARRTEVSPAPADNGRFELVRYFPETDRVVLVDEHGNLWTGTLKRVEV